MVLSERDRIHLETIEENLIHPDVMNDAAHWCGEVRYLLGLVGGLEAWMTAAAAFSSRNSNDAEDRNGGEQ